MGRHFLLLYAAIIGTLTIASWGQDQIWRLYGNPAATQNDPAAAVLAVLDRQLQNVPRDTWPAHVRDMAAHTGLDLELMDPADIAGADGMASLQPGEVALMSGGDRIWALRQPEHDPRVLVFRYSAAEPQRTPLEWALSLAFFAAIALVLMLWLWPLTRDLRALERATLRFGDRNWSFDARITPRSPVWPLADAFRRMAQRIDGLIRSHQDMSNALSHEIKTPLSRMRFEIELARSVQDRDVLMRHLDHLNTDIAELNAFVTATLEYAVLERAEVALNLAHHDFTTVVPAVAESALRGLGNDLELHCRIAPTAQAVLCDAHLIETVLRNLLYNASRYAQRQVMVSFIEDAGHYRLTVEDDGPGIAPEDRERVFNSFVQLERQAGDKTGFGLGLAIVKRIVEWHGGHVAATASELGGACFMIQWSQAPLALANGIVR